MSIREKFGYNQNLRSDIVESYKKYKGVIQTQGNENVLHQPDRVDIVSSNMVTDNEKPDAGYTLILKGSRVDNNQYTDDVITLEHVKYNHYNSKDKSATHNIVEYTETLDGCRQVIIERIDNKKGTLTFTEVDNLTGKIMDTWTQRA